MRTRVPRLVAIALVPTLSFVLFACDRTPTIQLKTDTPQTPTTTLPKPGGGIDPSGNEGAPAITGYRIFCESSDKDDSVIESGRLGAASSVLRVQLPVFDSGKLVVGIRNLVPLENVRLFRARFLFEGEPLQEGYGRSARKIYLSQIDVAGREGHATVLGQTVAPDKGAANLAKRLNLKLRNYGVSSLGNWLIVPNGQKLALYRAGDASLAGALEFPANQTFFPSLDEHSGILSLLRFEKDRFVNVLVRLALNSSRPEQIVETLEAPLPPSGWTAMPAEFIAQRAKFAWTERPLEQPETMFAVVQLRPGEEALRAVYDPVAPGSVRIPLSTAFVTLGDDEIGIVWAFEHQNSEGDGGGVMLNAPTNVFGVALAQWPYPFFGTIARQLVSSRDHEKWIGIWAFSEEQHLVFRPEGALVQNGAGNCRSPVLVPEE